MRNMVRRLIPDAWLRDWGSDLLKKEGNLILKVTTDLMIISTVDIVLDVRSEKLSMEPGSALGIVFTKSEPIYVTFHPPTLYAPMEVKI